jgi:hypothetical protein
MYQRCCTDRFSGDSQRDLLVPSKSPPILYGHGVGLLTHGALRHTSRNIHELLVTLFIDARLALAHLVHRGSWVVAHANEAFAHCAAGCRGECGNFREVSSPALEKNTRKGVCAVTSWGDKRPATSLHQDRSAQSHQTPMPCAPGRSTTFRLLAFHAPNASCTTNRYVLDARVALARSTPTRRR